MLVLLTVLGLVVYRADSIWGVKTYRAHGVSFQHPADWHEFEDESAWPTSGDKLWTAAVRGQYHNVLAVHRFRARFRSPY